MKIDSPEIESKLVDLQNAVKEFIGFYHQDLDFQIRVNPLWSAKDILGHITFWHESFARNISALGKGQKPLPLQGKLSEVNARSVEETEPFSHVELINRLKTAQQTIEEHIGNESIGMIPYKKGSRDYSRLEHLEIVAHHIQKHLKGLRKAVKDRT
ncbi:hypothetical protein KFE98_20950 [bacterium SCSIO 12741]|nr:hypothetical protein KFE98_20950 [bacterium SCSIO 12741]